MNAIGHFDLIFGSRERKSQKKRTEPLCGSMCSIILCSLKTVDSVMREEIEKTQNVNRRTDGHLDPIHKVISGKWPKNSRNFGKRTDQFGWNLKFGNAFLSNWIRIFRRYNTFPFDSFFIQNIGRIREICSLPRINVRYVSLHRLNLPSTILLPQRARISELKCCK